ncbi:MAG TPA: T9SS type A sorting domain-containing protein [Bacteroidia bacterium]|nr:T9SS type A sorting domain-containing protein [Bacteroidia bacterium]
MKKIYILLSFFCCLINYSHGQWQQAPGPFLASNFIGMDIKTIVPNGNYLGAIINNHVYVSIDNGASWIFASYGIETITVTSIIYKDSMIVAGTYYGCYISFNHGSTYKAVNNNLPVNVQIIALAMSGSTIIAAARTTSPSWDNVCYSTDYCNTWDTTSGMANEYVRCLTADSANVYAGTQNGVFMSANNGLNWINIGLTSVWAVNSIAAQGNRIFASEDNSSGGVYLSLNAGASWTTITNGLQNHAVSSLFIGDNYVYAGALWYGVYRTNNNGANWTQINGGLNCTVVHSVAAMGNNAYAGCDDGISVSTNNGNSWYHGLRTFGLFINAVAIASANVVTSTDYLVYTSEDTCATWTQFLYNSNTVASNSSRVFLGTDYGFGLSDDDGLSWTFQNPVDTVKTISTKGNLLLAGTYASGIYFSGSNGSSWQPRNNGLNDLYINAVIFSDTVVFAGTNSSGVYVSYDYGLNWVSATSGIPDTCIRAMTSCQNHIYAGTRSYGIYRSDDNGITWTHMTNGFSAADSNVLCMYTSGQNVFAGILGGGFFMSTDYGNNWASFNDGLVNLNITSIVDNGTDIFAGTHGGSIFKRAKSQLPLAVNTDPDLNYQNTFSIYPNPVKNDLAIQIKNTGKESTMKIFNVHGSLLYVQKLATNKTVINTRYFADGIYFLQIESGEKFIHSKFIKQ